MKVLVTNCTRNSGLAVLRTLADAGCNAIGADDRALPFGLHSRYTPPYELLADTGGAGFIDSLEQVIERQRPDVLIPFSGAAMVSQARQRLGALTEILVPDYHAFQALHDKQCIVEQCQRHAIPCPAILDIDAAARILERHEAEAVVVKPRLNLGGGEGVAIVRSAAELRAVVARTTGRFGETIITEYVPGPDSNNLALHIVFDRDTRPVAQFAFRKIRLSPPGTGVTAAAATVHEPGLLKRVLPLFADLGWQGPADVEFKVDAVSQQPRLIEINARFSGAVSFAIACGVNLPLLTCRAALGARLPESLAPDYEIGIKYWNPIMYLRSLRSELNSLDAFRRSWRLVAEELRGKRTGSPYRWSDPAPFFGKSLLQLRSAMRRQATQSANERARS